MEEDWGAVQRDAARIQREGVNAYTRGMQQAGFERQMGSNAARAGLIGAGTSLLTGGLRIALAGYDRGLWGNKNPLHRKKLYRYTNRWLATP